MAVVDCGLPCSTLWEYDYPDGDWFYGIFPNIVTESFTIIPNYSPVTSDSMFATFCHKIEVSKELDFGLDAYYQFAFFEKEEVDPSTYKFTKRNVSEQIKITKTYNEGPDTWTLTADSSHVWWYYAGDLYQQTVTYPDGHWTPLIQMQFKAQSVEAASGEYLGLIITGAEYWDDAEYWVGLSNGYWAENTFHIKAIEGTITYFWKNNNYVLRTDDEDYGYHSGVPIIYAVGTSGAVADACQEHGGNYCIGNTVNGYGSATIAGFNGSDIIANLITPWGESLSSQYFYDGVTRTFDDDSGKEHWSLRLKGFSGPPPFSYDPYECWWSDKNIYYVKTGGSDSSFGGSWATAFKTITKGAQTVPNGGLLFIEEGTYSSETQIQPTVNNASYIIQPASHIEAPCIVTVNLV